ncbi:hypothetical protein GUJ93_ZPchr0004g39832 [Zizania palustris]|uniref:ABC transporter domain-containing protein n=1 Tax=Zizania palustris TaxID=103762 RepID=A0A8J5RZX7_ZIZPA|nr:hypothetical protein GUJ93_ZPchr0004g39832 [Zizania palustris]
MRGVGGNTRRTAAGQAMVELQANASSTGGAMVVGLSPLSETLWRDNKSLPGTAALIGDVSARLTWKDLSVTVALGPGKTQTVLDELTGYAEPGSLTALMGPSGSGKSTLLDALAGRLAANAFLSGNVLLNGRKAKLSFGAAAYVTQDDNLIGTLTSTANPLGALEFTVVLHEHLTATFGYVEISLLVAPFLVPLAGT